MDLVHYCPVCFESWVIGDGWSACLSLPDTNTKPVLGLRRQAARYSRTIPHKVKDNGEGKVTGRILEVILYLANRVTAEVQKDDIYGSRRVHRASRNSPVFSIAAPSHLCRSGVASSKRRAGGPKSHSLDHLLASVHPWS